MKGFTVVFPLLLFILSLDSFLISSRAAQGSSNNVNGVYIVYMGAATPPASSRDTDHAQAQLLASVLKRGGKKNTIVRSYRHGFSGFAARLSAQEAQQLSKKQGVVSVFPDPVFELHTTRSWDFLKYQTDVVIDSIPIPAITSSASSQLGSESDTIIGILDTGIWPESASFNDKDMGPIPTRWNGSCNAGTDDNNNNVSFTCNRKIIGARFYDIEDDVVAKDQSARDMMGHGTHVASTAAGQAVEGASYYGLAAGTAIGGSPGSRIAVYRVCSPEYGCTGSNILAAFDDAIADGVDVLSLSLGGRSGVVRDLTEDPIALGAFHAVERGITVVCSAGNDGPSAGSVVNFAPWILTVAASTIDRDFESDILLGGNKVIKGESINFSTLEKSPVYPLTDAKSAKRKDATESEARNCDVESLDGALIKGKIVLCDHDDGLSSAQDKKDEVKRLGGIGVIVIDDETRAVASAYGSFPLTVISKKDAVEVLAYINSTRNPVATILPTVSITKYKPAPAIAYFSARGPSPLTRNILKPDITAPGVNILAAWMGNDTAETPEGKSPPLFNVISGTSMSCPHVSGVAATVIHQNPTFSPSAVKSAIMTTATQTNNLRAPITADSGSAATPYDFGAGEVSTTTVLQPGLVYETTTLDYLNFLCYYGYDLSKIGMIARTIPKNFTCPKNSSVDPISDMNYPSIAISSFNGNQGRTISRTVTNVAGDDGTIYGVAVDAPQGLTVKVIPEKLQFTKSGQKLSYQVIFSSSKTSSINEDVFGSITWSNGKYRVRSPFVLSSKSNKSF